MASKNSSPSQALEQKKKTSTAKKKNAPKAPTPGYKTRAAQACLLQLHQLFHEGFHDPNPNRRFPTAAQLGKKIGRARATVFRLLQAMKDHYGLPVDVIPERGGYGYTEEVANFPEVQFNQGE